MRSKIIKQIFTIENITRFVLVSLMLTYCSYCYGFSIILTVFSAVISMVIIGCCLSKLYDHLKIFIKIRKWKLSKIKTVMYLLLISLIVIFCWLLLPINIIRWSFSSTAVILFILLIIDVILGIFHK